MAHFGNCDPETTADQEYCIFHKPNKSEEEAREFYRKFLERFKPRVEEIEIGERKIKRLVFEEPVDARGFVFPEIPDVTIEYKDKEDNEWNQRFTFENAVFKNYVNFYQATFKGVISFEKAEFNGVVSFASVEFDKFVIFRHSEFKSGALPFWTTSRFIDYFSFPPLDRYMVLPGIVFNGAHFKNGVTFYKAKFRGIADFRKINVMVSNFDDIPILLIPEWQPNLAIFTEALFDYVSFRNANFLLGATFDKAEFDSVIFNGCTFGKNGTDGDPISSFREATFKDECMFVGHTQFRGYVAFDNSIFYKQAIFQDVYFENVTFNNAKFFSDVKFYNCIFKKSSNFQKTQFVGVRTNFEKLTFNTTVSFDFAEFKKVVFKNIEFMDEISFRFATFHNEVQFKRTEFKKGIEFSLTMFKGKTSFDGSIFERLAVFVEQENTDTNEPTPKFHDELSFANCDFRQGADFLGSLKNETNLSNLWEFFSSRFSNPQAMIEALRVQRLSFEKEGKRDEADRMFVLEMRAKRRARLQNARNKFERIKARVHNFVEWLLADLPSEYGTNWVRLFLFSLLVIIGNAVPYAAWDNFIIGIPETSNVVIRFANALYYSLVTFTTLGYGDMHPTGWLKALSAIEALTGAVFMALIVAVIARKWMR